MPLPNSRGNIPGAVFYAAYSGSSMDPTLRDPEILEIRPYGGRLPRAGDVVFFSPPETARPVVHRLIRVTRAGLRTRGDNNAQEDVFLLLPESVKGRVAAAWRGQKRRKIAGGFRGRLTNRWLRWRRVAHRGLSRFLHPFYQALSRRGWIVRALPVSFRPRVVVFQARGRDQVRLLLGRRIIGRFDDNQHQWHIRRPFQLFVDGRLFPGPPDRDRANREAPTEGQRNMPLLPSREMLYRFALADGNSWEIAGVDEEASAIVSQLGRAMQLRGRQGIIQPSPHGRPWRLLVQVDAGASVKNDRIPLASENGGGVISILRASAFWGGPYINLTRLSLILARQSQAGGGVLLHGGLAERDGLGVILAAAGGTGKTTASNRLPAPWRSLCDDTTLVVRDPQGRYWAHPWPTWSRFLDGEPGGTWDVQNAVPLKGIFFLARAAEDRAERLGLGHTVSMLVECAGQASMVMALGLSPEELRAHHLERFNNLCALARITPAHRLHLSLNGAFWQEMERTLKEIPWDMARETIRSDESEPAPLRAQ